MTKNTSTKIEFDENPTYGGPINFASNVTDTHIPDKIRMEAFNYGFKLGWQTAWYEEHKGRAKLKKGKK